VRDEDALLAGAPQGPLTLPTEITDPPESLVVPPPPPVVAEDLEVDDTGAYSAVVTFTTDQDVAGIVGLGWDVPVSFASDGVGREHRVELVGLVPDTEYTVKVISHTGDEKPELSFYTEPRPRSPDASIADGRVELDGQPFFPVTAYGACPSQLDNLLDAGVNVFGWDLSCGADEESLLGSIFALDDRAYWTVPWAYRELADDGLIGYTQPDEPDGLGLSPSLLPNIDEPGRITFLTLTQHFAPGTGDLPWQYPGYYEGFVPKADVFGVDFYPLQGLCSPEKLALNHDVQVELLRLTGGKPTLQWIETAEMNCPGRADAAITDATLRAEMLLAIAGGANGLGVFPSRLDIYAALAVRTTLDTIEQAWPMLMTPRLPLEIGGDGASVVRGSARVSGGATMVVVANSSPTQSAAVELKLNDVGPEQRFVSIDDALEVEPDEGILRLELKPLEAHILVAAPSGFDEPVDPADDDA
nr:fibronectin type III domain-containing protein [Actinomycetota bacterium]